MSAFNESWHETESNNDSVNQVFVNSSSQFDSLFYENERLSERVERTNIIFIVSEIIVALFAACGNFLVILVFLKERRLRRKRNYYIMSLAMADIGVALIGIPVACFSMSTGLPSSHHTLMCLLPISILLTFCNISIFSLFLISIDRIFSINLPLNGAATSKNVLIEIAICWFAGLLVGILPVFWHKEPITETCLLYEVLADGFQIFRFIFVILIPALTMLAIYCNIYKIILRQLKREAILKRPPSSCCELQHGSFDLHACPRVMLKREIRATVNISLIVLVFVVSWFPLHILNLIAIFCKTYNITREFILLALVFAHSNSAVNPMLYAYHMRDIRKAILKLLGIHVTKTMSNS